MGLFSFIKGQFIEVIEWLDDTGVLVHRFPAYDNAIEMGAQLTVRESQAAIFLNEGKIADVFGPGPGAMGLALTGLAIENLSLPEEVERMIDIRKRSVTPFGIGRTAITNAVSTIF
ncbi:SPFH domain-containing protein [Cohnella sp. CFH 77786]|uniref:SPFH domain-containing protein n=1 Tax=Cohnella sp. CFH 77786 TaxID=2662265 RepID=UPI0021028D59|nr:SPFH domain-containing protein [Cohnella sp. CFH 77786]